MTRDQRVRRPFIASLAAAALIGTTVLATGPASAAPGSQDGSAVTWSTSWTSQPAHGDTSTGDGFLPAISGNGRVVTFTSDYKLDSTGAPFREMMHGFLRRSGSVAPQRLATLPGGQLGNSGEFWGCDCRAVSAMSADGQLAVFASFSSNLTPGDTNETGDVFLRNLATGAVTLVSHAPDGSPGNGNSDAPQMSRDGRWVLYNSEATNIDGATGPSWDAYLYDSLSGLSHRVTGALPYDATSGVLSGDGSTIVFARYNEFNARNVYALDLATGSVSTISVTKDGALAGGDYPSVSDNASTVAYLSDDRRRKIMVTDVNTHRSIRVPVATGSFAMSVQISGDGKRLAIVRTVGNTSGVVVDVVDLTGALLFETPASQYRYIHPVLDRDGSCVAYDTDHADVPLDGNGRLDVYTACES